eukprot:4891593-Ditylum_brightwellii.AAC.1
MYGVDSWDLICAPKHGKYVIDMYGRQYKLMVRFGDSSANMLWSNTFSYHKRINQRNKAARQRDQSKFTMKALGKGLQLMLTELNKKRDNAKDDDTIQFYTESNQNYPSSTEYHHSFKSTGFIKNPHRTNLCKQLHMLPSGDPQVEILKKGIKNAIRH